MFLNTLRTKIYIFCRNILITYKICEHYRNNSFIFLFTFGKKSAEVKNQKSGIFGIFQYHYVSFSNYALKK
jgi:hypothetical protein